MLAFPDIATSSDFALWRSQPERWLPLVREIARMENVAVPAPSRFATGTNLVVDLGSGLVLKLFPPFHRPQFASERATLRRLAGRVSVPIPALQAEGDRDGWSWLVMTKLAGVVGSDAWPVLPEPEKERVLEAIGHTIAEVQAVPAGDLARIEPAWPGFIARQTAACIARHRRQGLAPRLIEELGRLLHDVPAMVPLEGPDVILTGEWIPENVLLSDAGGRWRLAAVIDFGDVMTGWCEYDLLGPSTFMCAGRPTRVRRLFEGYGAGLDQPNAAMRRRLLTLMMLHRASDLRNLRLDGWEARIGSLFDLEDLIWPI